MWEKDGSSMPKFALDYYYCSKIPCWPQHNFLWRLRLSSCIWHPAGKDIDRTHATHAYVLTYLLYKYKLPARPFNKLKEVCKTHNPNPNPNPKNNLTSTFIVCIALTVTVTQLRAHRRCNCQRTALCFLHHQHASAQYCATGFLYIIIKILGPIQNILWPTSSARLWWSMQPQTFKCLSIWICLWMFYWKQEKWKR